MSLRTPLSLIALIVLLPGLLPAENPPWARGDLRVSQNHRYLVHADRSPFFYLGDTAWELFHRLSLDEAEQYLENRRRKRYTVIQAVVLAEFDGLTAPNANGDLPLEGNDPTRPNERYFRHVDAVVDLAARKGLYIGMLPTWGDKVDKRWGVGPVIFNPDNAAAYGSFLGRRYGERPNIIWILGGDRPGGGFEPIWRAMGSAIREADGGRHLITYHPMGGRSSAEWFHRDGWLDFNMLQSGHAAKDLPNYEMVERDYNRQPIKPAMDGEPRYEDHPVDWKPDKGWFDDFDVRQAAYWALFAGAQGHTYGCHDIWQFLSPGRKPISSARTDWRKAIDFPGAAQMTHVRALIESRPMLTRVPDQSLIAAGQQSGGGHVRATRGDDYAFIYLPFGTAITVQMGRIAGAKLVAWWFDPRSGNARRIGVVDNAGTMEFDPPGESGRGNDWVLVLDDAARRYSPPGKL